MCVKTAQELHSHYTILPISGTFAFSLTQSFTVLSYLCFILSTLRRWDKSAAIQELFSFLGIGTKQRQVTCNNAAACMMGLKTFWIVSAWLESRTRFSLTHWSRRETLDKILAPDDLKRKYKLEIRILNMFSTVGIQITNIWITESYK